MREINMVVVHVSDSPDSHDFGATDIEQWHKERAANGEPWRHFTDDEGVIRWIGYHYVVRRNGTIEVARPEAEIGCHTIGYNQKSVAICWVGEKLLSPEQRQVLSNFVAQLCIKHQLASSQVKGHHELYPSKTCPNFSSSDTYPSMDEFRAEVERTISVNLRRQN